MDNKDLESFFDRQKKWKSELFLLRNIALDCGLLEELKWKQPCYSYQGKNILIISYLKDCCVMGFFKGVLLADPENLLVSPGENSRHVKQFKFTELKTITKLEAIIKAYIFEAIEVEKAGLKVPEIIQSENQKCAELADQFSEDNEFETAFKCLTTGRQRAYNLFFSGAKHSKTRLSRIEKYRGRIIAGFGINDCTCGHTKRKPICDGSHKNF